MLANVLVNYPDLTFIKIFTKWTKHAVHEIECSVQRLVKKYEKLLKLGVKMEFRRRI